MDKKDYILEGDVFVAYVGDPNIVEFEIPDGVRVIKKNIFQQTVGSANDGLKIKIPASVEIIETCAFNNCNIKSFEIDKNARIKTIGASTNYDSKSLIDEIVLPVDCDEYSIGWLRPKVVKVPKGCTVKKLNLTLCHGVDINLILPKIDLSVLNLDYDSATTTHTRRHLFYGGEISDQLRDQFSYFSYVYENMDTDNIEYVNKLKSKGISYFKTDKGIIVNELNNAKAKFEDLPTEYDGMPILDWNLVLFKEKTESYSGPNNSEKMTGSLYPKLKYYSNKEEENFDQASKEYFDYREASKAKASSQTSSSSIDESGKAGLGLLFGFGVPAVVTVIMSYLKHEGIIKFAKPIWGYLLCNMIWPSLFIYLLLFNLPIFMVRVIIRARSKAKQKKIVNKAKNNSNPNASEPVGGIKHSPKLQIVYNNMQPKNVNRAYFLLKEQETKLGISERELAQAQADLKRAVDNYIHGTPEERARREISNKLDTLNKNISESNKASSYDVYDSDGSHIGRIDKK